MVEFSIIEYIAEHLNLQGGWVVASILVLYAYKKVKDYFSVMRSRKTRSMARLERMLKGDWEEQETLAKELIFEEYFGSPLSGKEISFFVRASQPSMYFRMYISARRYLEVDGGSGCLKIRGGKNLKRAKWRHLGLYGVFGVVGLFMLFSSNFAFQLMGPDVIAPWSLLTLSVLAMAAISLDASASSVRAQDLLKELAKESEGRRVEEEDTHDFS